VLRRSSGGSPALHPDRRASSCIVEADFAARCGRLLLVNPLGPVSQRCHVSQFGAM
jgi:hypothetical protein